MRLSTVRRPVLTVAVALVALSVVLGGTSFAAVKIAKNSVTSRTIRSGAVKAPEIARNAVRSAEVKKNALRGRDIKESTLSRVPRAAKADTAAKATDATNAKTADVALAARSLDRKRIVATAGGDLDSARAAAPKVELFSLGQLSVYAKCYTDTGLNETFVSTYIESSVDGAIVDSRTDTKEGGTAADFLNDDTAEVDRELEVNSADPDSASMFSQDDSDFTAFAPDGTALRGWTGVAVKNGTLPGGNGVYGDGNVCLVTGAVFGS